MPVSIGVQDILAMNPCPKYPEARLLELFSVIGKARVTARDIMAVPIPAHDKLWLLCRQPFLEEQELQELAAIFSERAEGIVFRPGADDKIFLFTMRLQDARQGKVSRELFTYWDQSVDAFLAKASRGTVAAVASALWATVLKCQWARLCGQDMEPINRQERAFQVETVAQWILRKEQTDPEASAGASQESHQDSGSPPEPRGEDTNGTVTHDA